MKISVTKKLLIFCLSLMLAVAAAVFTVLQINNNAYAEVAPDGVTSYADGEGEEGGEEGGGTETPDIPGPDDIVEPNPIDPDGEPEWVITFQEIIIQVGKLEIEVSGWPSSPNFNSQPDFNPNPNGSYSPELVEKIENLLKNPEFIIRTVLDIDGNEITDSDMVQAGHTYFIHVSVCEKYADSVTITYADGVQRSLAFTAPFLPGTVLQKIPMLSPLEFEFDYKGKEIDLKTEVLDNLLKDKDHILQFVASESDELKQNGAGEFHLRICFIDGVKYCWDTTVPDDRSALDIIVTIKPLELEVKTEITAEIFYTGFEIDVIDQLKELYGEQFDCIVVAYGYTTKQTDAGKYEFNIIINPEYADSVKWQGGHEGAVTVKWEIKKSIIHGDWGPEGDFGRITITSDTYQGGTAGAVKYVYVDVDTGLEVDVKDLKVGATYEVSVELLNPDNLDWDVNPGSHIFTLTQELIFVKKPVISPDKVEYSGNPFTFEILIDEKPITDPENADKVEIVADGSDSLTQTAVGVYKVIIRLKDGYVWEGNVGGDLELSFEITLVEISVEWSVVGGGIPVPEFETGFSGTDFSEIVEIKYINAKTGLEVKRCDLVKGETYVAVLVLKDETNFQWKSGAKLDYTFTLEIDIIVLDVPALLEDLFDYTGEDITVNVDIWDQIKDFVEIVDGSFTVKNAGDYTIILRIKDGDKCWKDGANEYVKLTFTVNRAVLEGEWGSDGRIEFSSTFKGNYDEVVEYIYHDSDGNVVDYKDLKDGATYTVSVKLKEGMDKNFDPSKLPDTFTFTFKISSDKSSFPWWIFLIIAAVIIIIIIIVIIIVMKKRNKDDDYDDFYGDEYYGDEDGMDGDDEYNPDGYDSYGGEADYGADTY